VERFRRKWSKTESPAASAEGEAVATPEEGERQGAAAEATAEAEPVGASEEDAES
jgi:hypothetical protein